MNETLRDSYERRHGVNYVHDNTQETERVKKTLKDYISTPKGKEQALNLIDNIMDYVDFEKIVKVRDFEGISWRDKDKATVKDLKENLLNQLFMLFDEGIDSSNYMIGGVFLTWFEIFDPESYEPDDFDHCVSVHVIYSLEEFHNLW